DRVQRPVGAAVGLCRHRRRRDRRRNDHASAPVGDRDVEAGRGHHPQVFRDGQLRVVDMKRTASLVAVGLVVVAALSGYAQQKPADWPAVAGDVGAMKYSPADQITPANVASLKEAWTYPAGG